MWLLKLLDHYSGELTVVEAELAARLADHEGYLAIQAITGVGPIMAAVFVAEIGNVTRFGSARHLCSWAGLTPSHRESDRKVQRGHITKQPGPALDTERRNVCASEPRCPAQFC